MQAYETANQTLLKVINLTTRDCFLAKYRQSTSRNVSER